MQFFFLISGDAAYSNVICQGKVRKLFLDIGDTCHRNKNVVKQVNKQNFRIFTRSGTSKLFNINLIW